MRPAAALRDRPRGRLALMLLLGLLLPGRDSARGAEGPIALREVSEATGIAFVHTDGGSGARYIMETVTAGLATFDFDGDGLIDIYFLNGAPLRGASFDPEDPPKNRLYRNNGDWTFTEVTEEAGVGDTGYGLGVVVGDYNNNGLPDIFVNNFGGYVLYRNNGDGTFTEVSRAAGLVGEPQAVGAGACFLDADGDGTLDLFVSSYLDFTYETHIHNVWMGYHVYPGPDHYPPTADRFFRNNGDGTFTDASVESGIAAALGRGMGTVCADFNNNGHTDILVANDSSPNFLFENDGRGAFREVGLESGVAFDLYGSIHGSMGIECGDYDNDGWLDFYQTSYQGQLGVLYRNLGGTLLEDVTMSTGAGAGTLPHVTWGVGLIDFDNDGHRDLYIACGHLYDNVDLFSDATSYRVRNILLRNDGRGRFLDVSDRSGDGLLPELSSRGAAFDDLDNSGRIDVVVLNSRSPPTVLRNESPGGHHWLQVELEGTRTNRDGVGARVTVAAGDLVQVAEVHAGRSYQSHYGTRLHFGLGRRDHVDRIEVRWIGGDVEVFESPGVDRLIKLREGTGGGPM